MSTVSLDCSSLTRLNPIDPPAIFPLEEIAKRVFKNPFFWGLCFAAGGAIAMISSAIVLNPLGALGASALVVSLLSIGYRSLNQNQQTHNFLFCECSMMLNQLLSLFPSITQRPWFSPITDFLAVGACPLSKDVEQLKAEGYSAVLSMIEPSETDPHLFGVPAKPHDWQAANIHFLNLPTPDRTAVLDENVEKGVEFIHKHISQGRKVLVHCMQGISRSATIAICYLIKHQGMTPKEAADFIKSKRAIVANENYFAVRRFAAHNLKIQEA